MTFLDNLTENSHKVGERRSTRVGVDAEFDEVGLDSKREGVNEDTLVIEFKAFTVVHAASDGSLVEGEGRIHPSVSFVVVREVSVNDLFVVFDDRSEWLQSRFLVGLGVIKIDVADEFFEKMGRGEFQA